jgi:hypothetical protein
VRRRRELDAEVRSCRLWRCKVQYPDGAPEQLAVNVGNKKGFKHYVCIAHADSLVSSLGTVLRKAA